MHGLNIFRLILKLRKKKGMMNADDFKFLQNTGFHIIRNIDIIDPILFRRKRKRPFPEIALSI